MIALKNKAYPETGKIKLPPEYLREIAISGFYINQKLFLHRLNFIIKRTRIQAFDIEIPHPLCPPLLGGEGEEKERGAAAPLGLPPF